MGSLWVTFQATFLPYTTKRYKRQFERYRGNPYFLAIIWYLEGESVVMLYDVYIGLQLCSIFAICRKARHIIVWELLEKVGFFLIYFIIMGQIGSSVVWSGCRPLSTKTFSRVLHWTIENSLRAAEDKSVLLQLFYIYRTNRWLCRMRYLYVFISATFLPHIVMHDRHTTV